MVAALAPPANASQHARHLVNQDFMPPPLKRRTVHCTAQGLQSASKTHSVAPARIIAELHLGRARRDQSQTAQASTVECSAMRLRSLSRVIARMPCSPIGWIASRNLLPSFPTLSTASRMRQSTFMYTSSPST